MQLLMTVFLVLVALDATVDPLSATAQFIEAMGVIFNVIFLLECLVKLAGECGTALCFCCFGSVQFFCTVFVRLSDFACQSFLSHQDMSQKHCFHLSALSPQYCLHD